MRALVMGAALLLAGSVLAAQRAPDTALRFVGGTERAAVTDWSALADSLRDAGRHREAIAAYERAMQLGAVDPARAAFGVARAYAQLGNGKQALRWLEHAVSLGMTDRDLLRSEPSFEPYRDLERFRAIVESIGWSPGARVVRWPCAAESRVCGARARSIG